MHKHIAILATAIFTTQTQAAIIINEVDYDQPGTDSAEFIELFNTGSQQVDLDGYTLQLINGSNSDSYRNIELSGFSMQAGEYLVVCSNSALVLNCDHPFTSIASWLQNGAPDGVALVDDSGIIDSMTYEGEITGYTEGSTLFLEDSNTGVMSLARIPDGTDSNDNFIDFQSACITPGTTNIAGTGDCSSLTLNPVPTPAALWLFSSGLLGLAGIARSKRKGP